MGYYPTGRFSKRASRPQLGKNAATALWRPQLLFPASYLLIVAGSLWNIRLWTGDRDVSGGDGFARSDDILRAGFLSGTGLSWSTGVQIPNLVFSHCTLLFGSMAWDYERGTARAPWGVHRRRKLAFSVLIWAARRGFQAPPLQVPGGRPGCAEPAVLPGRRRAAAR